MVKIELENRDDIVRMTLTSNKGYEEIDLLDALLRTICTAAPKRGCFKGDTLEIDVLKSKSNGDSR